MLRGHAQAIWNAGVAAVNSERLVGESVQLDGDTLTIAGVRLCLPKTGRIAVVGAGKAGAGMAAGFERAVPSLLDRVIGWVNVPADCVQQLSAIHLHAARPPGVNEPTEAGVEGTRQILSILKSLTEDDVCVVLISGGGSALLPAPRGGISLADKLAVTRLLMSGGATIDELNCVRRHLSDVKGGELVRHTCAKQIVSLIISDVVGDPLPVIASGPTVRDSSTPADALRVLEPFSNRVPSNVLSVLRDSKPQSEPDFDRVTTRLIGNNETALAACEMKARELGYSVINLGSNVTGVAREVGQQLAARARSVRDGNPVQPVCILSGGEPVVQLVPEASRGKGGRNQEVALAAASHLWSDPDGICVLSGGTDGEDGPTDAAGGVVDHNTVASAKALNLDPLEFLDRNNAYPFLQATESLLKTGPTHTNVMDLHVTLVESADIAGSS